MSSGIPIFPSGVRHRRTNSDKMTAAVTNKASQAPSIVKHLKRFRIGCLPFVIKPHSFHEISVPFLAYTLTMIASRLSWVVAVSLNWESAGPFTDALIVAKLICHATYFFSVVILALLYRKEFDKTINNLIELQRCLGTAHYSVPLCVNIYAVFVLTLICLFIGDRAIYHSVNTADETPVKCVERWIVYWILNFALVMNVIYNTTNFGLFCYLVCCLTSCFKQLSKTQTFLNVKYERYVQIYSGLLGIASDVNRYHDAGNTLTVLTAFLLLIEVMGAVLKSNSRFYADPVVNSINICLLIGTVFFIIYVCHSATNQALCWLCNNLLEVSLDINHYNDANITMTVLATFLSLVITSSTMLKNNSVAYREPVVVLVPVSLLLTTNYYIIHVCHSVSKQADKANSTLVSHIIYRNQSPDFDDSYAMLHLCAKKSLSFKMCKSMTINYNLGMSMIAAYITYTIILFQIDITAPPVTTGSANITA